VRKASIVLKLRRLLLAVGLVVLFCGAPGLFLPGCPTVVEVADEPADPEDGSPANVPGNVLVNTFTFGVTDLDLDGDGFPDIVAAGTNPSSPCPAVVPAGEAAANTICVDVPGVCPTDGPCGLTCAASVSGGGAIGCTTVDCSLIAADGTRRVFNFGSGCSGPMTAVCVLDADTVVFGGDGCLEECDTDNLVCEDVLVEGLGPTYGNAAEIDEGGGRVAAFFEDLPNNVFVRDFSAPWRRIALPFDTNDVYVEENRTLILSGNSGPAVILTDNDGIRTFVINGHDFPYALDAFAKAGDYVAACGSDDAVPFCAFSISSGSTNSWYDGVVPDEQGGKLRVGSLTLVNELGAPPGRPGALAAAPPTVFAGTNGGMFRSTDFGKSFVRIEGVRTATVTQVLVTPERLYLGTFRNANAVYRSTDGGATWSPGNAVLVDQIGRAISAVGNNVVASGERGIFRSTDGGATFVRGVSGLPAGTYFFGMTTLGSTMLGGSVYLNATSPGGIYRSTDGGATWTSSGQGLPTNINVTQFAVNGNLLVAAVTSSSTRSVYRSTDGGSTWSPGFVFPQASSVSALTFAGSSLYAGLTGTAADHLLKSTDGGVTFAPFGTGLANRRVLSLASTSATTLFAGTYAGLFWSTDAGSTWGEFTPKLRGIQVFSLAATADHVHAGTVANSIWSFGLPPQIRRLLPIVLDVDTGATRFTSELALTNASRAAIDVTLRYTASIGEGSGEAHDRLAAGEQRTIPDAIAYLRRKGVPIPETGNQGGTLLVTFQGHVAPELVSVTARTGAATVSPQPVGKAGLAYVGKDPSEGFTDRVRVYALRSNETDRSNFAVYNTADKPVTLRVTAFSGDPAPAPAPQAGAGVVIAEAETLPPYGWKQYNRILDTAGFTNGYVTVERISSAGAFGCYGVINDNGTNDGSFLEPTEGFVVPYLNVPVLVETSAFVSELVLANSSGVPARLTLTYKESLAASGGGGTFAMDLSAGAQRIVPNAIDFLRSRGVVIGPRGDGSYAGALHIGVSGAPIERVWAGARTASLSPAAGQFGLFTPAVFGGGEEPASASLYGLQSNADNRSNVAVINTATSVGSGPITLSLQAHDGDAGGVARGDPDVVTLGPGQWKQLGNFLSGKGVANGWVRITRTAGNASWIAYGVVNDGGQPGQRTGDGAYLPMSR